MSAEEYPNSGAPVIIPGVLGYEVRGNEGVYCPAQGIPKMGEAHSGDLTQHAVSVIQEGVCCSNERSRSGVFYGGERGPVFRFREKD